MRLPRGVPLPFLIALTALLALALFSLFLVRAWHICIKHPLVNDHLRTARVRRPAWLLESNARCHMIARLCALCAPGHRTPQLEAAAPHPSQATAARWRRAAGLRPNHGQSGSILRHPLLPAKRNWVVTSWQRRRWGSWTCVWREAAGCGAFQTRGASRPCSLPETPPQVTFLIFPNNTVGIACSQTRYGMAVR